MKKCNFICEECGLTLKQEDLPGDVLICPECGGRLEEGSFVVQEPDDTKRKNDSLNDEIQVKDNITQNKGIKWVKNNLIICALISIILISFTNIIDDQGSKYVNENIARAAESFAVAKILNSAISVIQNINVDIAPAGVGMTIGIGQVLDPINDLVEKLSTIMFLCTISLGIQKIILHIGNCLFIKLMVMASAFFVMHCIVNKENSSSKFLMKIATKSLLVFVTLRFLMPVIFIVNKAIVNQVEHNYAENISKIRQINEDLLKLNDISQLYHADLGENDNLNKTVKDQNQNSSNNNIIDKFNNVIGSAKDKVNSELSNLQSTFDINHIKATLKVKFAEVKNKASEASEYLLKTAIIFLFQTIISPLVVLWGLLKIVGRIFGSEYEKKITDQLVNLPVKKIGSMNQEIRG